MDAGNDYYGPMAAAIAKRAYPKIGRYETAGRSPADRLDEVLVQLMAERGLDLQRDAPRPIDWVPGEWRDFHIIVSLEGR